MKATLGLYLGVFKADLNIQDKLTLNIILNQLKRRYWGVSDLADIMGVSETTAKESLKRLENKGYISRYIAPGKRYYLTKATTKACALIGRMEEKEKPGSGMTGDEINALFRKVVYGE